ncbi:hypothetical protein [Clostridium butyricum]|uniref:hypothetical protein n=1 Tax=Clostridium butyricum TaxID=1492 RepID=UPI00374E5ECC
MINIEGLKKADVLKELYNNSKPLGMGFLQFEAKEMTTEEAEEFLKRTTYFDYLKGRVMKVDLSSDTEFEEWLYDRDNGQGSAQRVINSLKG